MLVDHSPLQRPIQRSGDRIRVNVQLIDAESGNHLWADRFDKTSCDLLQMQDEIVARVAGALNAPLIAAEAQRAERSAEPASMDLYFQGMAWVNKGLRPHFHLGVALQLTGKAEEARAETQAGLSLDPTFTTERYRSLAFNDHRRYLTIRERTIQALQ